MTPKEKAKELVHKYIDLSDGWVNGINGWNYKKQCALIAVNEIIESNMDFDNDDNIWCENGRYRNATIYWGKVKKEIENL